MKAKYIVLLTALYETILIIYFLREISTVMNIPEYSKIIKCTIFKDNNSIIKHSFLYRNIEMGIVYGALL